ncbi:MAG: hypothetical protein ABSE63_04710 [Thermoguttaceae bacterium]
MIRPSIMRQAESERLGDGIGGRLEMNVGCSLMGFAGAVEVDGDCDAQGSAMAVSSVGG